MASASDRDVTKVADLVQAEGIDPDTATLGCEFTRPICPSR